jgi:uncharacterized membrane protein YgdD (TMEM256/DUF423 family)
MKALLGIYLFLGALGIMAGAFGAHLLEGLLDEKSLKTFETAVRYQMYQVLAGLLFYVLHHLNGHKLLKWSFKLNIFGIFIFSGSLYALVFSGIKILGAITPIGGLLFIVSWVLAGFAVLQSKRILNQ